MDPAGPLAHDFRQLVGIGRFELRQHAIVEHDARQRIGLRQFLQNVFRGGRLTGRGFARDRDLHLLEQHLRELFRRLDIEFIAGDGARLSQQFLQLPGDFPTLCPQQGAIDQYSVMLHTQQHRDQRLFKLLVQSPQLGYGFDLRPQRVMQPQGDIGIFRRVFRRLVHRHLVERELFRALAGNIRE